VLQAIGRERTYLHRSLISDMKAVKNKVEILGMHEAHLRDCGAAVPPPTYSGLIVVRSFRVAGDSDL
jgi:hypothetical protein